MIRWSPLQRHLHWWTATLVVLGFAIAWIMVALPFRALLLKFALYQVHKTIGLTVLALLVVRLAARRLRGRPPDDAALPDRHRRAAAIGQAALYALLLVVPALGYLTAASAPLRVPTLLFGLFPVPHLLATDPALFAILQPIHRALAVVLVVLAAGHAALALHHHRRGRATLTAMWPSRL